MATRSTRSSLATNTTKRSLRDRAEREGLTGVRLKFPWGRVCLDPASIAEIRRTREGKYLQWLFQALDNYHPRSLAYLARLLDCPESVVSSIEQEERLNRW